MIESYLARDEGKTLEFKENCRSLTNIVRTVVAFTNTAGGTVVIGVRDRTKEVVGLSDVLAEEERLASAFAESIQPLLLPDIQVHAYRKRELIVIQVPHAVGPYYIRSEGRENGVYVRLGSTNRRAGPEMIAEIERLARNECFDELPCSEINTEAIDFRAASELFSAVSRSLTPARRRSLGLVVEHGGREVPTIGAVLLFGKDRSQRFPDATVRCARFAGTTTSRFLDQTEIDEHLPRAVERAIAFIERHTTQGIEIGRVRRRDIPQYPPEVVREALINAVVHTDYAIPGAGIKVAIFDDRIEITNPGGLPLGLTLEAALAGASRLRNRVLGRVFRELGLIEQWGTGMGRMVDLCAQADLPVPRFEELGTNFRITLSSQVQETLPQFPWQKQLVEHLAETASISTQEAAQLWQVSARTARTRLQRLAQEGVLASLGTSPKDPRRRYTLKKAKQ